MTCCKGFTEGCAGESGACRLELGGRTYRFRCTVGPISGRGASAMKGRLE